MANIEIALATYNAGQFLDPFIESLLSQTVRDWQLIARDDGSTDGTRVNLAKWQGKIGDRLRIVSDGSSAKLGVVRNFNAVLAATAGRWVMLADQDDVWLPHKIETTAEAMRRSEREFGPQTPIAICTDAAVVGSNGKQIAPSYWNWSRMKLNRIGDLHRVAVESIALGCTMMVNRALLDLSLPIDARVPYHDWWLAMVAAAFGRIVAVPTATIAYRRHAANVTSDPFSSAGVRMAQRIVQSPRGPQQRLRRVMDDAAAEASAFLERFGGDLNSREVAALQSLANLPRVGPIGKRVSILRHDLWFSSRLKNVGLMILI